jgi:hypothetical protein
VGADEERGSLWLGPYDGTALMSHPAPDPEPDDQEVVIPVVEE